MDEALIPEPTFDEHYERLIQALADAVTLLRRYSKDFWVDWLDGDRQRIERGDQHALAHLLSAFGGMGSFTDLLIHPANGDPIDYKDVDRVNQRLTELRGEIGASAAAMRRELNRS